MPIRSIPLPPALLHDIREVVLLFGLGVAIDLALSAVRAASWPRYLGALRRLHSFCRRRGFVVRSLETADEAMAELVQEMYTDGEDMSAAQALYAAWQATCPSAGRGAASLPRTHRALQAWGRLHPAVARPPMPWILAVMVAH